MDIKDSGQRRTYPTGAVRDRGEDKGLPSLISPIFIRDLITKQGCLTKYTSETPFMKLIGIKSLSYSLLMDKDDVLLSSILQTAVMLFRYEGIGQALQILSIHLEKGAKKYEPRNWEKGFFLVDIFDSLQRHIDAMLREEDDEDHYAACLCNIMFFYHTFWKIKYGMLPSSLNDLPQFKETEKSGTDGFINISKKDRKVKIGEGNIS